MSARLRDALIARITADGPLTWAAYMEAALYDERDGFFTAAPRAGVNADFITSPHVSSIFADLVANQAREVFEGLGEPEGFRIVDLGANDGVLAAGIAASFGRQVEAIAVDRNPAAHEAARARGLRVVASIDDLEPGPTFLVANELFDDLPFHRVRAHADGLVEVFVDAEAGRLVERELPASPAALEALRHPPAEGGERLVSPAARAMTERIASILAPGAALIIDYGTTSGDADETVRGYRDHRLVGDLLLDPGSADITGPVDFEDLAATARGAGLSTWGPVLQREALHALGYRSALTALRDKQGALEAAGSWREAIEVFSERGQASMLVDTGGLGGFWVLAITSDGVPEPRATRSG